MEAAYCLEPTLLQALEWRSTPDLVSLAYWSELPVVVVVEEFAALVAEAPECSFSSQDLMNKGKKRA